MADTIIKICILLRQYYKLDLKDGEAALRIHEVECNKKYLTVHPKSVLNF